MAYDEDEQIARFKDWWQQNWKALAAGLAVGIGGIFGWNLWQSSGEDRYQRASVEYSQLVAAIDRGALEEAALFHQTLVDDFRRTPYAVIASMQLAAVRVEASELDAAAELLEWSRANARDDGLKHIARLRLARVRLAQGDAEAARRLVDGKPGPFESMAEELRGDIALREGDRIEARAAYERALPMADDLQRDVLRKKLDDLADVASRADA